MPEHRPPASAGPTTDEKARDMVGRTESHAVVIGASMAGLLGARALADAYERVTIVERDRLPAVGEGRKAVPQGRHVHLLLPAGRRCLDELLPGLGEQLIAAGASPFGPDELRFEVAGHVITRDVAGEADETSLSASRPLIEGHVRRRVLELSGVEVIEGASAVGVATDRSGERITGVRIKSRDGGGDEQLLDADLVLAATGRGGRVPAWLEELGYPRPAEERLAVELLYATRTLRRKPGALGGDKWVLIGARPGRPRTLVLSAVEGDRWLLTLAGYGPEHHPPTDEQGFMEFAANVGPPEVVAAIRDAEPLGEIATHGFPANQRRRYEQLDRLPEGLLVAGDAIASFNPLYGQGMTVAALEAAALRDCLSRGEQPLAERFLRAATKHIDHAWQMAIGSDLALPEVEGERPLGVRALNSYIDRLLRVAQRDPVVASAFRNVVGMLRSPTHVMRPAIALRVLRG
jgi:2-polyprenyl-6-methoxyphenol hydroxylase-like FAD-dependent oxidoreductase